MTAILVSGLINIETTLKIDNFPFDYAPVRYPFGGVNSSVSGVGYNIARALTILGDDVHFLSLIGQDAAGYLVRQALSDAEIRANNVLPFLDQTPQSVILYDGDGRRAINVDLKDIQEQLYPVENFEQALSKTRLAVLCNINFSRPMLVRAKRAGIPIATDVHAIYDLESAYDGDFMAHADVLFQSHENLPCSAEDWIRRLWDRYGTPVAVVGVGTDGAVLGVKADNAIEHVPAVYTRPIVNTIGAGDALFSAFVHVYAATGDAYLSLKKAVVFASYKIGVAGAADGFLTAAELDEWAGH